MNSAEACRVENHYIVTFIYAENNAEGENYVDSSIIFWTVSLTKQVFLPILVKVDK